MKEEWRVVPGFERYRVSNVGRIQNTETGFFLTPMVRKGYHCVCLYLKGRMKTFRVHVLVKRVFEDNWDTSLVCAHLDGNKNNNALENIVLCTQAENIKHKYIHGTMPVGSKSPNAKLTEEQVAEIRRLLKTKDKTWKTLSNKKIAKMFGISETNVWDIEQRNIWKHVE